MSEESRLADPVMRERSDRIYTGGMEDYSHRDLCDDFVMLQDENARLRELAPKDGLEEFLWDAFKRGGAWVAQSEHDKLRAENAKLRELTVKMAKALGVHSDWCERYCALEFECNYEEECPILTVMREL